VQSKRANNEEEEEEGREVSNLGIEQERLKKRLLRLESAAV